jgi:hypothetical protein
MYVSISFLMDFHELLRTLVGWARVFYLTVCAIRRGKDLQKV